MSLYVNLISTFDDKGLKKADGQLGKTEGSLGKFGKAAGVAFAAAGAAALAYAGTLLVDGVKAAIEDEKAQAKLATALKNTTGATDDQIAAAEDYITKTSLAVGVTDDELRPSLERLALATGDVTEAQKLQNIALDVAAGTGKSLESVSNALGKAYDGNFSALTRLGVPLDENIIKTKDFDAATQALADAFGGQASVQADTFEGKMTRLNIAFTEAQETVGSFILDAIQPLADFAVNTLIPVLQDLGTEIGEKLQPVIEFMKNYWSGTLYPILKKVWELFQRDLLPIIQETANFVSDVFNEVFGDMGDQTDLNAASVEMLAKFFIDTLKPAVTGITTVIKGLALVIGGIIKGIQGTVEAINNGIAAFNRFKEGVSNSVNTIKKRMEEIGDAIRMPFKVAFREVAKWWNSTIGKFKITIPDWVPIIGGKTFSFPSIPVPELANGGIVKARRGGTLALIGEGGRDEAVIPLPKGKRLDQAMGGITINVSGALDPEAVARQIETILKRSRLRAGAY